MIIIHHLKPGLFEVNEELDFQITFKANPEVIAQAFKDNFYMPVARIDTDSLNTAYIQTNTFSIPWWELRGIEKLFEGQTCRSTVKGDVFELNGVLYAVDSYHDTTRSPFVVVPVLKANE